MVSPRITALFYEQLHNFQMKTPIQFPLAGYTLKAQHECVLALLDKIDQHCRIASIRKDMKKFNTTSIKEELEKHEQLLQWCATETIKQ